MKKSHHFQGIYWQLMVWSLCFCSLAFANPFNPIAIQGTLTVENTDPATYQITVSDEAYIYWDDFSTVEGELIQFHQPSSKSVVVVEVTKNNPSTLLGTLRSNGNIFLVNPAGVLIGENGYIDSYGFFASTLPACPCALIDGEQDVFIQGNSKASIINKGRIKAWENDVYLIAYKIENNGVVDASNGTVAFAAGQEVVLNQSNGQKVGTSLSPIRYDNEDTGINNSGVIFGAKAELKADGNSYAIAIHHSGFIDVIGIAKQQGTAYLITQKGSAIVSGAIAVENSNGTGGEVQILGEYVFLFENSSIDASGDKGGGKVVIGSDAGEPNPALIAKTTFIDENALIFVDAIKDGDGGKVVIWADEATYFHGAISACGGKNSGNGGLIEISGKEKLDFQGEVDYAAPYGKEGVLLLNSLHVYE